MLRTSLLLSTAAALACGGVLAQVAPATATPRDAARPARTLVLQLATGPATPLPDLLSAGGRVALPRAERQARLQALLPAAGTRASAVRAARGLGLTVTGGDASALRVTGPAAIVDRLFPAADTGVGATRRTPAALASTVALALDAGDRTPAARPHLVLSGAELTAAYRAPLPGGYPRTRPTLTPQTPVVASLQLSGWDNELLTTYAQRQVFTADPTYDPVASGQYTAVPVDRQERWRQETDTGQGDGEVALDQQALLAAAPAARQRAYFGSNSAQGYLAVLNRVLSDVVTGVPIVAFSTSWGGCEALYDAAYLAEVERTLQRLTAAGVTLFAASGDDGLRDCTASGSSQPAVDYPASSPSVLGVGGTTHPNGAALPLPDTAWSAPQRKRGSGGGASALFPRPSWQALAGSGATRQVPDIALPADIETGFAIYTTDRSNGQRRVRGPDPVGGTSLAAPLAAGMLTDVLLARGPAGSRGLGDVHRQLYAAAASTPDAVRDVVTTASNTPVTVAAPGPGYDRVTGLGTPDWTALIGPFTAPAPAGPGRPGVSVPALSTGRTPLRLTPPAGADVVAYYAASTDSGCTGAPLSAARVLSLPEGVRTVSVRALTRDLVCGPPTTAKVTVPTDDRKASRRGPWSLRKSGAAFAGTYTQSSTAGATLTWTATGRVFRVLVGTAPDGGTAQVLIDGRVVRTLDTSARGARFGVLLEARAGSRARHSVTVRVLGVPGRGSKGTAVRVDGLVVGG